MISILYNPLSRNGNNDKLLNKIKNKVKKRFNTDNINLVNFFNLNLENFINELKEDDKVILVGGDGTLNFAANYLKDKKIDNDFYLYKAGTGNDFGRCFKGELVKLNDYITNLPKVIVNDHEYVYLNGCGIGVDGDMLFS